MTPHDRFRLAVDDALNTAVCTHMRAPASYSLGPSVVTTPDDGILLEITFHGIPNLDRATIEASGAEIRRAASDENMRKLAEARINSILAGSQ